MAQQSPPFISIQRDEYESFLAENQELVERYKLLLEKVDKLTKLNNDLGERLQAAEESLRVSQSQLRASEIKARIPSQEVNRINAELEDKLRVSDERLRIAERKLLDAQAKQQEVQEKLQKTEMELLANENPRINLLLEEKKEMERKLALTEEHLHRTERTVQEMKDEFRTKLEKLTNLNAQLETDLHTADARLQMYEERGKRIILANESLNKARTDLLRLIEEGDSPSAFDEDSHALMPVSERRRRSRR